MQTVRPLGVYCPGPQVVHEYVNATNSFWYDPDSHAWQIVAASGAIVEIPQVELIM